MNIEIANRLYELRKKYGYSQEELADKLGVSRQAISKWETASASPDTDNLISLAKLYGVTLDDLVNTNKSVDDVSNNKEKENDEQSDSKKEKVSITSDGIFVDGDEKVSITKDGIHVVNEDEEVHIGPNGICTKKDGVNHQFGPGRIEGIITAIFAISVTAAYFLLSAFLSGPYGVSNLSGWAFWWILFLAIPIPGEIASVFMRKSIRRFPIVFIVCLSYLMVGFFTGMWHPFWVLFLLIPVFYITIDAIYKACHSGKDYIDEDND